MHRDCFCGVDAEKEDTGCVCVSQFVPHLHSTKLCVRLCPVLQLPLAGRRPASVELRAAVCRTPNGKLYRFFLCNRWGNL